MRSIRRSVRVGGRLMIKTIPRLVSKLFGRTPIPPYLNRSASVRLGIKNRHLFAATCLLVPWLLPAPAFGAANWTILIYMNAKNNLEPDGIANFEDIASIGSNENVNIVVELGRPTNHEGAAAGLYDGWSGVYRFYVKEKMQPLPQSGIPGFPSTQNVTVDMGDSSVLEDFLSWGKQTYPATRYMVIIWNHGQGWRAERSRRAGSTLPQSSSASFVGGYRAVSFDDDTGSFLYNSDIEETVSKVFGSDTSGGKLDLLGFDACLMSMLETVYSVQKTVKTIVASEELEPGAGWPYALWLSKLVKSPTMDDVTLGRLVVDSYRSRYKDSQHTTLSVVNPVKSAAAASALSQLSAEIQGKLREERSNLSRVRSSIKPYGVWYDPSINTSIDLSMFFEKYAKATKDAKIKQLIAASAAAMQPLVLHNYASRLVLNEGYGGAGIAIYFPQDKASFVADPYGSGYLKRNVTKPVIFVQKETWSDFLYAYLQ